MFISYYFGLAGCLAGSILYLGIYFSVRFVLAGRYLEILLVSGATQKIYGPTHRNCNNFTVVFNSLGLPVSRRQIFHAAFAHTICGSFQISFELYVLPGGVEGIGLFDGGDPCKRIIRNVRCRIDCWDYNNQFLVLKRVHN